jgi:hypothetical protein
VAHGLFDVALVVRRRMADRLDDGDPDAHGTLLAGGGNLPV